jgi:hypothetical protein
MLVAAVCWHVPDVRTLHRMLPARNASVHVTLQLLSNARRRDVGRNGEAIVILIAIWVSEMKYKFQRWKMAK